jgi:sugar (pentulose or hexulose) kinase
MAGIYLGIDAGSTTLKAAAFDNGTGRSLAWQSERIPLRTGADGRREQTPAELDRALARVLNGLRRTLGSRWRELRGVGLASQGGSAMIADAATGRALTPMMLWNDARARTFMPEVARKKPVGFWRRTTWRNGPGHGLAKLLWFEAHHPGLLAPGRMFVGAGEYLYFSLTAQWRQDPCHALQIGCFNVPQRRLDARLPATVNQPLSICRRGSPWPGPIWITRPVISPPWRFRIGRCSVPWARPGSAISSCRRASAGSRRRSLCYRR